MKVKTERLVAAPFLHALVHALVLAFIDRVEDPATDCHDDQRDQNGQNSYL